MRELDKGVMFPKDNIAGDTKMMIDRIITLIPLLSFSIAKKKTKSRPRLKLVMLMQLKKNETGKNRRSEGGDSLEVTQKGAHIELDCG